MVIIIELGDGFRGAQLIRVVWIVVIIIKLEDGFRGAKSMRVVRINSWRNKAADTEWLHARIILDAATWIW